MFYMLFRKKKRKKMLPLWYVYLKINIVHLAYIAQRVREVTIPRSDLKIKSIFWNKSYL